MNKLPDYLPPVTPGNDLNTQRLTGERNKTITGEGAVIPIAYGKVQVVGTPYFVDQTDGVWTYGVMWCWGEIEAIDAMWINGAAQAVGVTRTDYLGTMTQSPDTTIGAIVAGTYLDDLIYRTPRGVMGIAHSVFVFDESVYPDQIEFIAELSARKVYDPREGAHAARRAYTLESPTARDSLDISASNSTPYDCCVTPDLNHMLIVDQNSNQIEQWDFGVPGEVSTLTLAGSISATSCHGVCCNSDLSKIWWMNEFSNVTEVTLSTPGDITTGTAGTTFNTISGTPSHGICQIDGLLFFVYSSVNRKITVMKFGSRDTLSGVTRLITRTSDALTFMTANDDAALECSPDGSRFYLTENNSGEVHEIICPVKGDPSSIVDPTTPENTYTLPSFTSAAGVAVAAGGNFMYVLDDDAGAETVHQFLLETAPATWEFSETPALAQGDFIREPMFGPGELVNGTALDAAADANDATVITEARRKIGYVIDQRQLFDTIRKTFDTYSGCWSFKRGDEWILAPDRPVSDPDVLLIDDDFVRGSFGVALAKSENVPTRVRVWYTDKTDDIWRDRYAEYSTRDDIKSGRISEVKMPGIGRYSQAYREAYERAKKLAVTVQAEGILFDEHIGIEPGDVANVYHKLGFDADLMRVIPFPQQQEAGRMRVHLQLYDASVYCDEERTKTFTEGDRSVGNSRVSELTIAKKEADQKNTTTGLVTGSLTTVLEDTIDVDDADFVLIQAMLPVENNSTTTSVACTVQLQKGGVVYDSQSFTIILAPSTGLYPGQTLVPFTYVDESPGSGDQTYALKMQPNVTGVIDVNAGNLALLAFKT